MYSEIELLKSQLEDSKIRDQTNLKLYQELLKILQDKDESLLPSTQTDELRLQSEFHNSEISRLKQDHAQILKSQSEHISNLKEHIKDLEFENKSEKLSYQQQILDLQNQILILKNDLNHHLCKKQELDSEKPSILRKQAEHIENLSAEIVRLKEDHKTLSNQLEQQGLKTIKELEEMYEQDKMQLRHQITQLNREFDDKL